MKRGRDFLVLAGWILLAFGAASMGAFFPPSDWYASLEKPIFNPPGWLFGPVWTVLYLMMSVAAWLVWKTGGWGNRWFPLALYVGQLLLNAAWSPLFFGLHEMGWALLDLIAMWCLILWTLLEFRKIRPRAGWLLAPYLAWVTFAVVLNAALWRLND